MKPERIDAVWIEERHSLSIDELGERWGFNRTQLQEFIAYGVLEPTGTRAGQGGFTLESVSLVRTACRLQEELELDTHAVGVVLELLQQVRALESELSALRARLPGERMAAEQPLDADVTS